MERLKISTSVGLFRVPTDDIAYIEASGNYCDVHLFNGESVTMTFQLHYFVEVLGMLQQNFFLRVGKSLIVNKNFVYAINVTNQELKLMDYRAHHSFRLRASKEALKELSLPKDNLRKLDRMRVENGPSEHHKGSSDSTSCVG